MFKKIVFSLSLLIGVSTISRAQANFAYEMGVIFGPITFQSDYGQRRNFDTNIGNTGFGIGVVHFINFASNNSRNRFLSEHFKIRSEISFNKTNLKHFGKWVESTNSITAQQLRAMSGSATLVNLGGQLEYSPFIKIKYYERSNGTFSPYLSLGFLASYYKTKATTLLGAMQSPENTPDKYLMPSEGHPFGFSNESGIVLSATGGIGTHYKLSTMHDLMFEARFQVFNSDWIDGLNPNKEIYKENKANDSQLWFNVGYIYYLEY